ncbi:MAG TPA: TetR family transcriptional regulator [Streptosporangiaceae bacterium]|jgi:AcrR family transcriptional regulator
MTASLRERKKAKTRGGIQAHALRLFREQGYEATTVEQIIEAAEVSESTFYRYFPAKADLVLTDEFDPLLAQALRAQPPGLTTIAALRAAIGSVLTGLTAGQEAEQRERIGLILSVPELRGSMFSQFADGIAMLAEVVAERSGRPVTDPAVRALSGAVVGALITAMLDAAGRPEAGVASLMDGALASLEAGLAL